MSDLDDLLMEEYERIGSRVRAIDDELEELPKGYLSKKRIKGNDYFYLQRREGEKIVSMYIEEQKTNNMKTLINMRKELEKERRTLLKDRIRLERILGVKNEEDNKKYD